MLCSKGRAGSSPALGTSEKAHRITDGVQSWRSSQTTGLGGQVL